MLTFPGDVPCYLVAFSSTWRKSRYPLCEKRSTLEPLSPLRIASTKCHAILGQDANSPSNNLQGLAGPLHLCEAMEAGEFAFPLTFLVFS